MSSSITEQDSGADTPAPYVALQQHILFANTVTAKLEGYGSDYIIEWGDGTARTTVPAGGSHSHPYPKLPSPPNHARPGAYWVAAYMVDSRTYIAGAVAVLRGDRLPHGYEITRDEGNTQQVEIHFTEQPDNIGVLPRFSIEWPKTKDAVTAWGVPGTMVSRSLPYGDHTVTIRDLTTGRKADEQVHVTPPDFDPDFEVRRKTGDLTLELEFTKVTPGKEVIVGWGDGDDVTLPSVAAGDKVEHTYPVPPDGETRWYQVQSGYTDLTGTPKGVDIQVPLA